MGVALTQVAGHDIDEIQGEDAETIAGQKAHDAYTLVQKPLVVTDDSWAVPALKGFPGAYMKSINYWFTVEDWLRLMDGVTDRRMILQQMAVYQDELEQVIFAKDIEAIMLNEPHGSDAKSPVLALISFDGGKTSVAESFAKGSSSIAEKQTVWHELAAWVHHNKPGMYEVEKH